MMHRVFIPYGMVLALAAMPAAHAQMTERGATVAPDASIARSDVAWMEKAVRAGIAEIEAGKLAMAQGKRDAVRNFGKTMVELHGKANEDLIAIAGRKRVLLPARTDAAHIKALASLAGLSGDAFDKEYIRTAGIKDLTDAAILFEDGASNLKDPDLKAYAQQAVPVIKRHFEMVREIQPVP